jgi:hypothetical protein
VASMAISGEAALTLHSQRLLFAGHPVLFNTNDLKIATYAHDFFPPDKSVEPASGDVLARVTVHVRDSDESCKSIPSFRARGQFALARFAGAETFWFNLRTREVYGVCSFTSANAAWRWHTHIFPTLLGILAPVIGVSPLHAACVIGCGGGVLLAGQSGVGKSTLAIAMAKRGYDLLSDDWTYLSASGDEITAWGLPVPVKLLPDASRIFPELLRYRAEISLNGEVAYEVMPDECFRVSRQFHCSVASVVLLERSALPGCRVTPIGRMEAIEHLVSGIEPLVGSLAPCYQDQINLIRGLKTLSCFRLAFNDEPNNVSEVLDDALAA